MNFEKEWNEVWWAMAEGDSQQYQTLKGIEEGEFFNLFDLHRKKIKQQTANHGRV